MMIDYGSCDSDALPDHIAGNIDTLRVCFHKKDVANAMKLSKTLKNKGYKVFIQPMVTASYSADELVSLITKANEMSADAFYLVDSHGTMNKDKFTNSILTQRIRKLKDGILSLKSTKV